MSIVTKTGDAGETATIGGTRVPKYHPRLHAEGTIDELNAHLGAILAGDLPEHVRAQIVRTQHVLFHAGADIASAAPAPRAPRISAQHTEEVEEWIVALERSLPPQHAFILPNGSQEGAALHVARTVCRRAERRVCALAAQEPLNPQLLPYLNRLGDYLFLAARAVSRARGAPERTVIYDA